jgi:hypothetical protein
MNAFLIFSTNLSSSALLLTETHHKLIFMLVADCEIFWASVLLGVNKLLEVFVVFKSHIL